ncbi:molybdopterin-dependent oxidoreductase [Cellulosilyticum ruminicola]|uniref:molybdopterin-dependent oxidoreductase n=1 Tax=Cellulosilyticum ruminicola TaxID=425254 RepID=UPI0006D0E6B5|nr:molybdopterin-dependent oxidoreductase [Cellulosilyticum ruminicola]
MKKISHGCTLDCFDCCKFNVYVSNNQVTKIEGDPLHPYTKGFICPKGRAHLDRLNHPERLKMPLLKVGDTFQEISFEEALHLTAEKLITYKKAYGSHSILYYEQYGNGGLLKSIGDLFFNFYGGVIKQKGGPCWSAGIAAQKADFGDSRSHSLEDMLNSKAIFVWGKNPQSTTIHTMQMLQKAKKQGIPIIVIDPIRTGTAKIADHFIQIKPNGDYALALAMGKYIIENNLFDGDYIKSYVHGFETYRNTVKDLDLQVLLKDCDLTEETLSLLVHYYTQKHVTILLGYGLQKYYNGGATIRLIDALGAITGQIGFSGGGINYANKVFPSRINSDPYNSAQYDKSRYVYTSDLHTFITESLTSKVHFKNTVFVPKEVYISNLNHTSASKHAESISSFNVPLKMAVITKSNLLNQLSNLNALNKAFAQIEFKVCFEQFMTDTARACDLIIPATTSLESEDLLYSSMTNPYMTYNEQAVQPAHPLMDEYYFFASLAKEIGLTAYPQVSKSTYLNKVLEPLKTLEPEISIDYLKTHYFTCHETIAWENLIFDTQTQKIELYAPSDYISQPTPNGLRLLTTHSKKTLFSQHMMDEKGPSKAYISPQTAKNFKLTDGETGSLTSKCGQITVQFIIDDAIPNKVVMMNVGWWEKHGNPNTLTYAHKSDIGGQVAYHETLVSIIKNPS